MKVAEHSKDITELFDMLMTLEMQLVEQLEVRPSPWGTGVMRSCHTAVEVRAVLPARTQELHFPRRKVCRFNYRFIFIIYYTVEID